MTEQYDVVVVGGGTAGTMAALAAARQGALVCLVEAGGFVGGTCLALGNALPFHNSRGEVVIGGLPQELVERMVQAGGAAPGGHLPNTAGIGGSFTPFDPEVLKRVLFELLTEAGVVLKLHTQCFDVCLSGRRVTGVRVLDKAGVSEVAAQVLVDATGDADLAACAGAPLTQDAPIEALNATLLFRVAAVDTQAFCDDVRQHPERITQLADPYLREVRGLSAEGILARSVRSIHDMPYIYLSNLVRDYIPEADWAEWGIESVGKPGWGRLRPFGSRFSLMAVPLRLDKVVVNATSMTYDATDPAARSEAEVEGHRQVALAMEILRRYVPGFANAVLHSVHPAVSVRASRRIQGGYVLTREDIEACRRFEDAVARCAYPMSVQSRTQPNVREYLFVPDGGDYDVPYRCFLPREVEGLLVAGRTLSATREASGSARIGASCMAYGQGVGTAAALSVRERVLPGQLPPALLRRTLLDAGAVI